MKNQPNKAIVKDGLPTAKEILDKHALKLFPETYTGEISTCIIDAMKEYSDQQNAELRERVTSEIESREHWQRQTQRYQKYHRELNAALERVKELEGALNIAMKSLATYGSHPIIESTARKALKK